MFNAENVPKIFHNQNISIQFKGLKYPWHQSPNNFIIYTFPLYKAL